MFFIYLLGVNLLVFLPLYFFNIKEQPNPFAFLEKGMTVKEILRSLIVWRESSDPFRVLFEYSVFMLLFSALGIQSTFVTSVGAIIFSFSLIYVIYISSIQAIFKTPANINSDLSFLKNGIPLLRHWKYPLLIGMLLLLGVIGLIGFHLTRFLFEIQNQPPFFLSLLIISLSTVIALKGINTMAYRLLSCKNVFFVTSHFIKNIQRSKPFKELVQADSSYFEKFNSYQNVILDENAPNIKIISVEAYGAILFENEKFRETIQPFQNEELINKLKAKGYRMASSFSIAPIFGGGSWLSYSSILYGLKFDDKLLFELLFSESKSFFAFDSIFDILRRNGYKNFTFSGIEYLKKAPIDWSKIKKNLRFDTFFDYNDIAFKGTSSKFAATHTAIPDQYSCNKVQKMIREKHEGLYSLFYSTLNSHSPYESPTELINNWEDLDRCEYGTNYAEKNTVKRYQSAIKYQLDALFDSIDNGDDNSIYILFGDHQPAFVAKAKDGFHTPMHIIYKDEKFIQPFLEKGFVKGYTPNSVDKSHIRHEGFLSLLINSLNIAYGKNKELNIPYMPNGVDIFRKDV